MEYYFEERISILKCLETVISNSQKASHPYKVSENNVAVRLMCRSLIQHKDSAIMA